MQIMPVTKIGKSMQHGPAAEEHEIDDQKFGKAADDGGVAVGQQPCRDPVRQLHRRGNRTENDAQPVGTGRHGKRHQGAVNHLVAPTQIAPAE
jgi:hypothetical protein